MPRVSIIIPAHNAMAYLPETVESALKQTFSDFELLIINDGSSDSIEEWARQIPDARVKLISQEKQGSAVARNTGLACAQGEYIAFLDADDLWVPSKLEKQVQFLDSHPSTGVVLTSMVLADEYGKPTGRTLTSNAEGNAWEKLVVANTVPTSAFVARRCCFDTGGFDPSLKISQDWDLWIRIAANYPFAVIKEPLIFYRQHAGNITNNLKATEQGLYTVIEQAFQSVSPERMSLKKHSYGYANIHLGWKALKGKARDYEQATSFLRQAILYCPQLVFSKNCIRLAVSILLMQIIGHQGYEKVRSLNRNFNQRFMN